MVIVILEGVPTHRDDRRIRTSRSAAVQCHGRGLRIPRADASARGMPQGDSVITQWGKLAESQSPISGAPHPLTKLAPSCGRRPSR